MTENQGVGTVEKEKVAQDGGYGLEDAPVFAWERSFSRLWAPPSPEAQDLLRREPCTPPAPPATAPAAEETSSGGERCGSTTAGGAKGCCEPMRRLLRDLVQVEEVLHSGKATFASQGQAMDGFEALANFESIARKAKELLGGEG